MANSWNQQGQKKSKKEKKVVSAPVHKRHTIDMTRDRQATIVATEIRKAERKLAKRHARKRISVKLRAHIANLKVMRERLERGLPAEVRTKRDYAPRYRPIAHSVSLREAMTAPPAATVQPPATPDPAPAS